MCNLRKSPLLIALATCVATVGISTTLFFATWRIVIDLHLYVFGVPMSPLGAWVFIFVAVSAVLPLIIAVLGICLDRCVAWWQGALAFLVAITLTCCFIASPPLRSLLPIGFLGERTNSS